MRTAPALVRPSKKEMKWWIHNISCASDQSHRCRRFKKSKKKTALTVRKTQLKKIHFQIIYVQLFTAKTTVGFPKKNAENKTKQNKTSQSKKSQTCKSQKMFMPPPKLSHRQEPHRGLCLFWTQGRGGQQAGGMGEDKCAFSPLVI